MPLEPALAALIPHAGGMCLLDRVLDWDDTTIRAATSSHALADNPLATARGLRGIHLCEYGAQAMALHGGLLCRRDGTATPGGMLVSVRDVRLAIDDLQHCEGELIVTAARVQSSAAAWQYRFEVTFDGRVLADGRATVALG